MRDLQPGDHVRIQRRLGYGHDAIYVGGGEIIHFWCDEFDKSRGRVRRDRLALAVDDPERIEVIEYGRCFSAAEVVARAESQLGRDGYNLIRDNCQHFARWCKTSDSLSDQVEKVITVAQGAAVNRLLSSLAAGGVALAAAEGLSGGASLMSGLAAIGGTATGGLALLAAAPAAAAAVAAHRYLRDDPFLTASERVARDHGRRAAVGGAAGGVAASLALVHVAGVSGLSAVGITSGLAAIGSTMLGGIAVVSALPVAAAVGAAGAAYWLRRRRRTELTA